MYQTILVPLDGSNSAEIALPYALEIAAKLDAEITVVSVSESGAADMDHLYRSYLEHIKEEVRHQLKGYGAKERAKVFSTILVGEPAERILHCADDSNAGLVVMASRGSPGKGPWLLGNIAAKVLRASSKPVLLIRSPANEIALQEKRLVRRILVPLDGSKLAEAVIPSIEVLVEALGGEIVLFQVLEPLMVSESSRYRTRQRDEQNMKASAITYLDGVGRLLRDRGLKTSSVALFGSPAEQIIDYAKANSIDLIAMLTHGRSGIGRWVFGSVTDKVLHAGDTPVLVVRTTSKVRAQNRSKESLPIQNQK